MTEVPHGSGLADDLAGRVSALMPRAKAELAALVAIPSVADPRQFPPEDCRRAAEWVAAAFTEAGLDDVRLAETPDGSHAVLGHRPPPPGAPTVLLYCHYDVQPPLDDSAWQSPPFELTERDGRWYGRGTADCKGNILMHLTALRALGDDIPVGLKLVAEGSEEQGTGGWKPTSPTTRTTCARTRCSSATPATPPWAPPPPPLSCEAWPTSS